MYFCDKCGGMVLPYTLGGAMRFKCSSCNRIIPKQTIKKEQYNFVEKDIITPPTVVIVREDDNVQSTIREICPECGHDRASYELRQIRSADEAPTRFFTCAKCGHKWRDND